MVDLLAEWSLYRPEVEQISLLKPYFHPDFKVNLKNGKVLLVNLVLNNCLTILFHLGVIKIFRRWHSRVIT